MPERTENPISFRAIPGDSWRESFCRVRRGKRISNKSGEIIAKKLQSHTANCAKLPNTQTFLGIKKSCSCRGNGESGSGERATCSLGRRATAFYIRIPGNKEEKEKKQKLS